jgi:hypothetical protein
MGPWSLLEAAPAALGPSSTPWGGPGGWGGGGIYILAVVFLSTMAARGGQTGADQFSSKSRLVLPTAPQLSRGGRRNASELQVWATRVQLTHHTQKNGSDFSKKTSGGLTDPQLPILAVLTGNSSDPYVSSLEAVRKLDVKTSPNGFGITCTQNQIQTFSPPYLLSLRNRHGLALYALRSRIWASITWQDLGLVSYLAVVDLGWPYITR